MVDVVITPTLTPGIVNLDYLVSEDKPWSISSSISNTGTDQTGDWRQRFSYANYQLTGHDDVLLVHPTLVVEILGMLREALVRMHKTKLSSEQRAEKKAVLYDHITSDGFRRKLADVDKVTTEIAELDAERGNLRAAAAELAQAAKLAPDTTTRHRIEEQMRKIAARLN